MLEKILDFVPDKRYPGTTLRDELDTFLFIITFGNLRFKLRMWYCKKYGRKTPAYSPAFNKDGVVLENGWFVPDDGSFKYGSDWNVFIKE